MDVPLPNPGEMWGSQHRALVTRVPSSALSPDVSGSSSGPSSTCLGVLFSKGLALQPRGLGPLTCRGQRRRAD